MADPACCRLYGKHCPYLAITALSSVGLMLLHIWHWTRRSDPCTSMQSFTSLKLVVDVQTTDGLPAVLTDLELRARVYSEPLLPKSDKSVPRPDKAVWRHLTVRALSGHSSGFVIIRNLARMALAVGCSSPCGTGFSSLQAHIFVSALMPMSPDPVFRRQNLLTGHATAATVQESLQLSAEQKARCVELMHGYRQQRAELRQRRVELVEAMKVRETPPDRI